MCARPGSTSRAAPDRKIRNRLACRSDSINELAVSNTGLPPLKENMNIVYSVVFVCAVTVLLTWISARNQGKGWRGVVTKIQRRTSLNNDVPQDEVVIRYRTDSGKSGK